MSFIDTITNSVLQFLTVLKPLQELDPITLCLATLSFALILYAAIVIVGWLMGVIYTLVSYTKDYIFHSMWKRTEDSRQYETVMMDDQIK
jgi:cytochrome b subunit of formate dehydrogenase